MHVVAKSNYYSKKMLGCFNPILGQIWTFKHWVTILNYIFNPMFEFVHI